MRKCISGYVWKKKATEKRKDKENLSLKCVHVHSFCHSLAYYAAGASCLTYNPSLGGTGLHISPSKGERGIRSNFVLSNKG